MNPEAWTFFGVAITALAGIVVVIIQNLGQSKQLTDGDDSPTLRALVQSLINDRATEAISTAEYRAEIKGTVGTLQEELADVKEDTAGLTNRMETVEDQLMNVQTQLGVA